jgi:hypothetical protein
MTNKTLEDLYSEHGVKSHITNGKICLNYDQIEASNSDPLACQCRGLILREHTYEIVACPMFRFFNLEQVGVAADIDWDSSVVENKKDGSCIIIYNDDHLNKWCCGTRGRAEADCGIDDSDLTFSNLVDSTCDKMWNQLNTPDNRKRSLEDLMNATQRLHPSVDIKKRTFVFELTSPINRIVCKYDDAELTLLAVRNNITLEEELPQAWNAEKEFGIKTPEVFSFNNINHLIQVIRGWNPEEREGVVVKDKYWNRVKVKNPSYVAYNHMRCSLSTSLRGCVEVILLGKDDDVIGMMPDVIVNRINNLKPAIKQVLDQTQQDYNEIKDIDDMKQYALLASKKIWPSALFALKRNKTPDLHTFALGNKASVSKIPSSATNTMIQLCKKVNPEVAKLEL